MIAFVRYMMEAAEVEQLMQFGMQTKRKSLLITYGQYMTDEYMKGWNVAHYGFFFRDDKSSEWKRGYGDYLDADLDDKVEIREEVEFYGS